MKDPRQNSEGHIVINGRYYPLWEQFVLNKERWIGGELVEYSDGPMPMKPVTATITDIRLEENGPESAMFSVDGEPFGCSCDVRHLAVDSEVGNASESRIGFQGYGGHTWSIQPNATARIV